jgi:hypothetical protein
VKNLAFFPVIALLAAGCAGTAFRWEDTERVKPGMTEAEVVAILGKPYSRTQSSNGNKILTWSFATAFGGARAVSYRFVDDKLAAGTTLGR